MADVAELIVALRLQDGVSRGLGNLNRELRGMQGGLGQVGRGIGQVGAGLGTIATRGAIAAAAGLTAVVTAAVSFEDAFAGVRKTVDATEPQFQELEDTLREMARTIPVSFEELAGIAEAGGALGIAREGLDEFTRTVADLAASTDLTADQAATSLGVLGNVLGLQEEDFGAFGSALVDLGNKMAATEPQILGIAERAGAAGELIGLSADQVLAFGAAAASVGEEAEAGGTSLQRFFIDALTAVEGGGEDLETFARIAGETAGDFQTAFREDAGGALLDFITGLGELPEAVQIETLADLGFNDVRITRLLLGLANNAELTASAFDIAGEAYIENSALGVEAAKRYGTVASQLTILKQNVTDAAVVIGEELLPVVSEVTTALVTWLNDPDTRRGIKEFGENLAGGIRDFVAEIRKADFGPLIDTLKGAAAIARGAFDAFRSLPAPIQQLALAALVANRVTGGAVGGIAAGLGNIAGGLIKIAFERGGSPANPLWVQSVGGGVGGGPGGVAGRGGLLAGAVGTAGAAAVVTGGVLAIEDIASGTEEGIIRGILSQGVPGLIGRAVGEAVQPLVDELMGNSPLFNPDADLWNPQFPDQPPSKMLAGFGVGAFQEMIAEFKSNLPTLPDTAVLNKDSFAAVLPDTAMAPVTDELTRTRLASEAKLAALAAKSDIQTGTLRGISAQIGSSNAKLAAIAAKNFSPTIKVENKVSSTVITNNVVQNRTVAGGYVNLPSRY